MRCRKCKELVMEIADSIWLHFNASDTLYVFKASSKANRTSAGSLQGSG
jgi:3-deoxy-D-manno-octulosonic acid (KDO) 8-phosphate synthase